VGVLQGAEGDQKSHTPDEGSQFDKTFGTGYDFLE
jgi:hypothetical protein